MLTYDVFLRQIMFLEVYCTANILFTLHCLSASYEFGQQKQHRLDYARVRLRST